MKTSNIYRQCRAGSSRKGSGAVRCGCSWRDPESGSGEECGSVSGQGSNPRDQFHAKMEARQAKRKSSEGEIPVPVVFRLQS